MTITRKDIPAPECKALVELEDGTLVDEEELAETVALTKMVIDLAEVFIALA